VNVSGQDNILQKIEITGTGRAFVCFSHAEAKVHSHLISPIIQVLSERHSVTHLRLRRDGVVWDEGQIELVIELIQENGVRHAPFIAFGESTLIAQSLAVFAPKLVRTLILVDPVSRQTSSRFEAFLQYVERALPLGLPLRKLSRSLDREPFLHRVRCPVLVVSQENVSRRISKMADLLVRRLPCCWRGVIESGQEVHKLLHYVDEFQNVQARCPMKGGRPRSKVA
jgi:pimeloyl-ACP methyl ester carboxylesterase